MALASRTLTSSGCGAVILTKETPERKTMIGGIILMKTCFYCGEQIQEVDGVFIDSTGGDVCCADNFTEKNENGEHVEAV